MKSLPKLSLGILAFTVQCQMFAKLEVFTADKAPYYWKACMLVSHNQKKAALDLVESLKEKKPLVIHPISPNANAQELFDYLFMSSLARNPQLLSYLGLFESVGIHDHNAFLNEVTPEAVHEELKQRKKDLELLKSFNVDQLTPEQKVSYNIFLWSLEHEIRGEQFAFHNYRIDQMNGILAELTYLFTNFHRLETELDVKNYIARLEKIKIQLDQAIELLEHQKKLGIQVPAFTVQKVITSIKKMLVPAIKQHIFYDHLEKNIKNIVTHHKDQLLEQAYNVLENQVYPAYKKLLNYFEQQAQQITANNGVWALPNGDAYYAHTIERHTTTNMSADEIHELGLKEVASIHAQMRALFAQEGMDSSRSIGELVNELAKDERHYFPETPEGRAACLAEFYAINARAQEKLYPLFDLKPKAALKILAVPAHEEEGQPGAYYSSPSIDGKRPGAFFANLRNMKEMPKYHMETLTVHEAEPGHHFQLALQNEMDIPVLRKIGDYNVFYEGWALYTEKLAYEENFYSCNAAKIGHLQDELLRAVRLVVDTGIHSKRWTHAQAVDYMQTATGMPRSAVVTEIERYFVYPGQACSYKIGQLKILELRKKAKDALRDQFNIREFHNVILKLAAAPLSVLEAHIDEYIARKKLA